MTPLPVLNQQPAEKPWHDPEGRLDVQEVFYTLQGEGPFAGRPAVFVRLAGCDLQCPACDTDYTSRRRVLAVSEVWAEVTLANVAGCGLVVITGGEPFRQNITPLVNELVKDYDVQVESNGTLFLEGFPYNHRRVTVVVSPKTGAINPRLHCHVRDLKYILRAGKVDRDGLPSESLDSGVRPARPWPFFCGTVWVQPQDDKNPTKNAANLTAAAESVLVSGNRRLSVQVHKQANLP